MPTVMRQHAGQLRLRLSGRLQTSRETMCRFVEINPFLFQWEEEDGKGGSNSMLSRVADGEVRGSLLAHLMMNSRQTVDCEIR